MKTTIVHYPYTVCEYSKYALCKYCDQEVNIVEELQKQIILEDTMYNPEEEKFVQCCSKETT